MGTVAVTGASGFVGQNFLSYVEKGSSYKVITLTRRPDLSFSAQGFPSLDVALSKCVAVVHLAGKAHNNGDGSYQEYYNANTKLAMNLAKAAIKAKVRKFVYISSVKACRYNFAMQQPSEDDLDYEFESSYGRSKAAAEQELREICSGTETALVILRPCLVYGPGVKANFASLLKLIRIPVPLPFGAIKDERSYLYVGNLCDGILRAIESDGLDDSGYFISDSDDVSIARLTKVIRNRLGKPVWLIPVPKSLLRIGARILGFSAQMEKFLGSETYSSKKFQIHAKWHPPFSLELALQETIAQPLKPESALRNVALR